MSIDVALEDLAGAIAERGPDAYLVTVRETRPHVVAVTVAVRDEGLVVGAGRRTAMNVAERPDATLLWPVTPEHPKHTLLVDGTARASDDGEWLVITPTSAILHRAGGRRRILGEDEPVDLPPADG
ncbi:MAG: pyridoxamine 5'-phosphate oxidase family protein [Aquihabitans sp.]